MNTFNSVLNRYFNAKVINLNSRYMSVSLLAVPLTKTSFKPYKLIHTVFSS
jgi:hypothetical protein